MTTLLVFSHKFRFEWWFRKGKFQKIGFRRNLSEKFVVRTFYEIHSERFSVKNQLLAHTQLSFGVKLIKLFPLKNVSENFLMMCVVKNVSKLLFFLTKLNKFTLRRNIRDSWLKARLLFKIFGKYKENVQNLMSRIWYLIRFL